MFKPLDHLFSESEIEDIEIELLEFDDFFDPDQIHQEVLREEREYADLLSSFQTVSMQRKLLQRMETPKISLRDLDIQANRSLPIPKFTFPKEPSSPLSLSERKLDITGIPSTLSYYSSPIYSFPLWYSQALESILPKNLYKFPTTHLVRYQFIQAIQNNNKMSEARSLAIGYTNFVSKYESYQTQVSQPGKNNALRTKYRKTLLIIKRNIGTISDDINTIKPSIQSLSRIILGFLGQNDDVGLALTILTLFSRVKNEAQINFGSQPGRVYPYILVLQFLFPLYEPFENLFMGFLISICWYTIPCNDWFPQQPGQSNVEYKIVKGYLLESKGDVGQVLETDKEFCMRMKGLVCLLAGYLQLDPIPPTSLRKYPNKYNIEHAWTWVARLLNSPPDPFSFSCLVPFLTVAGWKMHSHFKKSYESLMNILKTDFKSSILHFSTNLEKEVQTQPSLRLQLDFLKVEYEAFDDFVNKELYYCRNPKRTVSKEKAHVGELAH